MKQTYQGRSRHKKFSEHVRDHRTLVERDQIASKRRADANENWIQTGNHSSRIAVPPHVDCEWSDEISKANGIHGVVIKLAGNKFDKGEVNISKFTPLLFEYFAINDKALLEYQEIKSKWGYLIDFRLSIFN